MSRLDLIDASIIRLSLFHKFENLLQNYVISLFLYINNDTNTNKKRSLHEKYQQ